MSIYEEPGLAGKIPLDKKFLKPLGGLAIAIALAAVLFFLFQPTAINAGFSQDPFVLSKMNETILTIDLVNISGQDQGLAKITVVPKDPVSMLVYPRTRTVDVIGANESRKLEFRVNANPEKEIAEGEYTFDVNAVLGPTTYTQAITLKVEK